MLHLRLQSALNKCFKIHRDKSRQDYSAEQCLEAYSEVLARFAEWQDAYVLFVTEKRSEEAIAEQLAATSEEQSDGPDPSDEEEETQTSDSDGSYSDDLEEHDSDDEPDADDDERKRRRRGE